MRGDVGRDVVLPRSVATANIYISAKIIEAKCFNSCHAGINSGWYTVAKCNLARNIIYFGEWYERI